MTITPWNKNISEINTKNIGSIRKRYLKKIGIPTMKDITLLKGKELFLIVIEDFKKGILSSDELSSFGFEIFHGIAKHHPKSDLFQASLSASDLRFEIRTGGNRIPECLEDIDKFYDKYK